MRAGFLVALAVMLPGLLAGCGTSASPSGSSTEDAGAEPSAKVPETGAWLVRYDASVGGPDGDRLQPVYLTVQPDGTVRTTRLPATRRPSSSGQQRLLLVDAGRRWALADSRPSSQDRRRHQVRLHSLVGGRDRTLDLGDVTPGYAVFDAERPGRLWVVRGDRVWTVDAESGRVRAQDPLATSPAWIFTGRFDKLTGRPVIESISSYRTRPAGNGELDQRPLTRPDGELLMSATGRLKGLPAPGCELVAGFAESGSSGTTWAWCVKRSTLSLRAYVDGEWRDAGVALPDAAPDELVELVFAVPADPPA